MAVRALFALTVIGAAGGTAGASELNFTLLPFPEISSTQVDVTYNASSLLLSANGFSISYEDDGLSSTPAHSIFGGLFTIAAHVNNAGVATGGTLTISGSIPDLSISNQVLLSGSLADFGFSTTGVGRLEFLFGSLGGVLGPAFLARGPEAGIVLNNINGFPHSFGSSWSNLTNGQAGTGTAVSDTGVVIPGPGAMACLLAGGLLVARRRR